MIDERQGFWMSPMMVCDYHDDCKGKDMLRPGNVFRFGFYQPKELSWSEHVREVEKHEVFFERIQPSTMEGGAMCVVGGHFHHEINFKLD
jgi:hypothetical protein